MGSGAITLEPTDLAIASALVLAAGTVSVALRLDLEKKLAVAAARTVVQLLAIGYVLSWLFALTGWLPVVVMAGVMIFAAGRAAVSRSKRTFPGVYTMAYVTLLFTGVATTLTVTGAVIGVAPWYRPQYVVPLLGMVLGNCLTGISLCLDSLLAALTEQRALVETDLALGATKWEAARDALREGTRRGMIPILNSMMVVGIVALPGMMTGQILEGADPLEAVKYQIVVMFMIAAGTALGCMLMALLCFRRLFNERHQLRVEDVTPPG
jgi:putative ABC transport system permease protein